MITTEVKYLGDLRTEARHLRSGEVIMTDAPTDNHGRGEAFSPTDLVAAALSACMLTIMGIKAADLGIDLRDTRVSTEKHMQADPRRIARLVVNVYFACDLDARQRKILEAVALTCPVAKSLHPEIAQELVFHYPQ